MSEFTDPVTRTLSAGLAVAVFALASCGGDSSNPPADNCSSFAGTYNVTTEVVSTDCSVGLHAISQPITWTFTQTAPSCSFTMTNSLYPGSVYSGRFSMVGAQARVTWTSVIPAPSVLGRTLTYTSESLTITPAVAPAAATLAGSFNWSTASPCGGTTNVCHGSVAAGCLNPS